MNLYQQLKRLGEIISELAALYGELSAELPELRFVGAPAPADSEVKKMPRRLFRLEQRRCRRKESRKARTLKRHFY